MPDSHEVQAVFLDFDGVVLDSVLLKERAFREIIANHFPDHLDASMEYFWANGGTSRVAKFRWIWTNIVGNPPDEEAVLALGNEFSQRVYDLVVACDFIPGAEEFLNEYSRRWPCYVISGTPEPELRSIVQDRQMSDYFRGVFGSPPSKVQIGNEILTEGGYDRQAVWFVGDATTDRDSARALEVRFVGISGPHLSPYLEGHEIMIDDLRGLGSVLNGRSA